MNDFYLNPENIKKQTEEMKLSYLYKVMQSHTGDRVPLDLERRLKRIGLETAYRRHTIEAIARNGGHLIHKCQTNPYSDAEMKNYNINPIRITIFFIYDEAQEMFEYAIEGAEAVSSWFKLKNYTPHPITLINEKREAQVIEIASSGVARVEQLYKNTGLSCYEIPIKKTGLEGIVGLPAPEKDTLYIVSQIVAQAAKNRYDLVFPGDFVRDSAGKIIGCKSLLKY